MIKPEYIPVLLPGASWGRAGIILYFQQQSILWRIGRRVLKRSFDILVSSLALIALSPLLLLVSRKILINLGKPILFSQDRPGINGKIFSMIKFRSMMDTVDKDGVLHTDSVRLTDFGKKLRSMSIDELPELWNVLKGEMSLVGPRPLLIEYLPLYSEQQARRHHVKPGITGWAQINGRNALSWDEKFSLDIWYVDNQSFWLDMKIIFITIKKVFQRDGISQEGEVTMSKFSGNH